MRESVIKVNDKVINNITGRTSVVLKVMKATWRGYQYDLRDDETGEVKNFSGGCLVVIK